MWAGRLEDGRERVGVTHVANRRAALGSDEDGCGWGGEGGAEEVVWPPSWPTVARKCRLPVSLRMGC